MAKMRVNLLGKLLWKTTFYPFASLLALFLAWEFLVGILQVPAYLIPAPTDIITALVQNAGLLLKHAGPSAVEAGLGFLLSVGAGIPLAILTVAYPRFRKTVMPFLISSQVVPKVAIAPLLLIWFGFGITSKVLIVFMMAFFPIFIAMISGLQAVEPDMLNLMLSMRPTKIQVFTKLRIPNSLPYLIDGLKLAVTRSVIAAIVAEWISSNEGLGYLILYADARSNSPLMFSIICVLAVIGLIFFMLVAGIGKTLVPWYYAMRKTEVVRN